MNASDGPRANACGELMLINTLREAAVYFSVKFLWTLLNS